MTKEFKKVVTILSGQTTSPEIDFTTCVPRAIIFPATVTGATITFTNSPDSGGTFVPVRNATLAGSATTTTSYTLTVTGNTSAQVPLDTNIVEGFAFTKVVSASSEGQDTTLVFICREGTSVR